MKLRTTIKGLDISAILHPKDKSTLDKLRKIPGFKSIVDKTVGSIMEKYAAIEYSAEGINVTDKSLPNIHRHVVEACRLLEIKNVPACSTDWDYDICSFSVGDQKPRIIL